MLWARPFDVEQLRIEGDPVPVVEGILTMFGGVADFGLSETGSLVYVARRGGPGGGSVPVWVDRQGAEEALSAPAAEYLYPRLSPDGRRASWGRGSAMWIWDFARETQSLLTRGLASYSVWSVVGSEILFGAKGEGGAGLDLFRKSADGSGSAELLLESERSLYPSAFTPDGRYLVFREGQNAEFDVFMVDLENGGEPVPLLATAYNELNADLSPDGRWLAYQSDESGRYEIYVSPFPDTSSQRRLVSSGGGREPRWSRDGRELFYRDGESGAMIAVPVDLEPNFEAGRPTTLFEGRYASRVGTNYDVAPDGQRFLMIKPVGAAGSASHDVVLVQNWLQELEDLVPTD